MEVSEIFQRLCTRLGRVAGAEPVTYRSLATIEESKQVFQLRRHFRSEDEGGVFDISRISKCIFNYHSEFRIRIGTSIPHKVSHVSTGLEVVRYLISLLGEFTGCYDKSPRVAGRELEMAGSEFKLSLDLDKLLVVPVTRRVIFDKVQVGSVRQIHHVGVPVEPVGDVAYILAKVHLVTVIKPSETRDNFLNCRHIPPFELGVALWEQSGHFDARIHCI